MKSYSRFLTIPAFLFASVLLVLGVAAVSPCRAAIPRAESDAERHVLEQLQRGAEADLQKEFPSAKFSLDKRRLRGEFLKELFTNRDPRLQFPRGINIRHAAISGEFDLSGAEIPYDVTMSDCIFDAFLELSNSHFGKNLLFVSDIFGRGVVFDRGTVEQNFRAVDCNLSRRC